MDFQRWLDPIRVEPRSDFHYRVLDLSQGDCPNRLTSLFHAAYRDVQARTGVRYWAAYQDAATTVKRVSKGETYLVTCGNAWVGSLTLYRPGESLGSPWYERPEVTSFGLFAVEPSCQGLGIGKQLIAIAERRAREWGMRELALDTADRRPEFRRHYEARGYRLIEYVQWPQDDFRSVVLSKTLG